MPEVYKPGSTVSLKGGIEAKLIAVQIETSLRVSYCVSWWDGRNRKQEWLPSCEVEYRSDVENIKIGFQ